MEQSAVNEEYWTSSTHTPLASARTALRLAHGCPSSDDPAEMFAASMPMVQDIEIDARDTGTAGMSADFDSVWGSPTDFDDMSGLFGDEGMKGFSRSLTA